MSEQHDDDDRHVLPVGNRRDDPPPKHWRWRMGLTVAKYPVQVAILLALVILALPLAMLVKANSDLRGSQTALRDAIVDSSSSRQVTSAAICRVLNENGRANNGQTEYLKALIIKSVHDSKQFEPSYRKLGLPPYSERLKQARGIAHRLDRYVVKGLDCKDLQVRIERDVQRVAHSKR